MTSHFIDSKVDAGRIIERVDLPEYQDDTIVDVSVRLYQAQLAMFKTTMDMAINNDIESFEQVPSERKRPYSVFPEFEDELAIKIRERRFPDLRLFFALTSS